MSLRRRRSGLRSNKKRLMNTTNDAPFLLESKKLKAIPEVKEEHHYHGPRDGSSSENLPKTHVKLLNDTILEEKESILCKSKDVSFDDDQMDDDDDDDEEEVSSESDEEQVVNVFGYGT